MTKTTSKKTWVTPWFKPHGMGTMNKFGHRAARVEPVDEFEGVSIRELIDTYGSPLFVTSESKLRANVQRIHD
ncbi:MAG: diaminopimelate decarboxylase, partial [Alphaproteobacteria bacterium]|nr:diaminopimelate decarboxylase [Alphaproteobacteria bacterium]